MKIFLCFILFFNLVKLAKSEETSALDLVYKNFYLGEKKTTDYVGPNDQRAIFNRTLASLSNLDELFNKNYLNSNISSDAFYLNHFWNTKILEESTCPDFELGENIEYIRYLFRLFSISYLFEGIKNNDRILEELGSHKNSCRLKYSEIFGSCGPKSEDMKKFHERVYAKFANEYEKLRYNTLSKNEIENWLDLFHKSSIDSSDSTFLRLHLFCEQNKENCKTLKIDKLKFELEKSCIEDKKLILNICNENDDLWGIEKSSIAFYRIKLSNAFNIINQHGMGEDCLNRFVKMGKGKEFGYKNIDKVFGFIYKSLEKEKSPYLEGPLFLPGALKEFDKKGLSDFLIALRPPKEEVKVIKKIAVVKKVAPVKPIKVVPVVKVEEPIKVEVPVEIPEVYVSEFELKRKIWKEGKESVISLDMDTFSSDFEFTSKMISKLSIPIKKFQTRQALTDMKEYDKLGSSEAPVGIIFLKYLIDTENHQGLYNVLGVLGDKFYVSNDFEGIDGAIFVELKNDSSTKNRWQINFIKEKK